MWEPEARGEGLLQDGALEELHHSVVTSPTVNYQLIFFVHFHICMFHYLVFHELL